MLPRAENLTQPFSQMPKSTRIVLDALMGIALLISLITQIWYDMGASPAEQTAVTVMELTLLGCWLGIRRDFHAPRLLWVMSVATLLLFTLPRLPATGLILFFVVVGVVSYGVGVPRGLLLVLAGGMVLTANVLAWSKDSIWSILLDGITITFFLSIATGFGSVARQMTLSRARLHDVNEQLGQANERLRASIGLQRELVLAEERARAARELHDGLGHQLTLIGMSLEYARRSRDRAPDRAWEEVGNAADRTQEALDQMRLWVRALNPPPPAPGAGTQESFEAIASGFRGTGLTVNVVYSGDDSPLPLDVSLFATRLAQEGLTNVLKHAHATQVRIVVDQSPDQLRVAVVDDGNGNLPSCEESAGFGLRSLSERALALGGVLDVGTTAAGGFQVAATIPLDRSAADAGAGEAREAGGVGEGDGAGDAVDRRYEHVG